MIPPCLTLSIIRYISRVKLKNPGEEVTPSTTPRYSSYWKGSLRVTLNTFTYPDFGIFWALSLRCFYVMFLSILKFRLSSMLYASLLLITINSIVVFNWNHFEMRILNLRIYFYLLRSLFFFVLILVVFVLFLLSLRFGQISHSS